MTCHAGTGFVFHNPDFTVTAPCGWAQCRRCLRLIDLGIWTRESCPGAPPAEREPAAAPFRGVPCALCGAPVLVDPMHRVIVEFFGTTCPACFGLVEAGT